MTDEKKKIQRKLSLWITREARNEQTLKALDGRDDFY